MLKFEQFLEAKRAESGQTQAVLDLIGAIRNAFQQMTRPRRVAAWAAVSSSKGKKEVGILINNPNRPLARFRHLRSIKEWMGDQQPCRKPLLSS
jgi:hypothetical protein